MRGVAVYCLTDNQMRAFSQFSEDTMDENSAGSEESQVQTEERRPSLLARFFKSGDLPYPRRIAYGIGHVFNDLCASMWFTYFLLFYHLVLRIDNSDAGLLVLIGQIADALTTPVVGHFCDNTSNRYGGRKTWHLIGTGMVACSLFFFWHECIYCSMQPMKYQILYFSCFIIVFQAGWATVQVSHLSLIPVLTSDKSIRVELNSIRYAFTILSNSGVFIVVLVLLSSVNKSSQITPNDQWLFSGTALGIIVVGLSFVFMFHVGTKEPSNGGHGLAAGDQPTNNRLPWYRWFLNPKFYLVALIYMSSRLIVNLTQVYSPLYMIDSLKMYRSSVAIIPLVIYFSGLIATFFMKRLNEFVGRYICYFGGLVLVWGSLVWFYFWPPSDSHTLIDQHITQNSIYLTGILVGIGGTTLLVTCLSMVSDLIGDKSGSSAFVFGAMSFTDKLSSGIAIQIIQLMHPCKGSGENTCCSACADYYRRVLTFVTGGASVVAFIGLALIVLMAIMKKQLKASPPLINPPTPSITPPPYQLPKGDAHSIQKPRQPLTTSETTPLINKIK